MVTKFSSLQIEAFLRTAGIEEAYTKYYADIPRNVFNKLVSADPSIEAEGSVPKKIGTYGQWILRMYKQGKLKLEDLEKTYDNLEKLISIIPSLKRKKETVDINKFKDPSELFTFLQGKSDLLPPDKEGLSENPELLLTNPFFIDNREAILAYEDAAVVIINPLTLRASQFYAEGTNWCTRYPDMFKQYTEDYPPDNTLWIIIFKNDPYDYRYQFHFPSQQFMNKDDRQIELESFLRNNKGVNLFLQNHYLSEEKIAEVLKQYGNENGSLGIQIDKMSDLMSAKQYNRKNTPFVDRIWDEGLFDTYQDDTRFKDIVSYMDISDENFQMTVKYLQEHFPDEVARYIEENGEINWSNAQEVFSFVDEIDGEVDVDDLTRAFSNAYEEAGRTSMEAEIIERLQSAFTDHFGVDFSNWYPGEKVYVSGSTLRREWFKFAGKDFADILGNGADFLLAGDENGNDRNYISDSDVDYAVERAEQESSANEDYFNVRLNELLGELE